MIGELRAVIAVSVLDSISQQSMTVKKQHDTVSAIFHGDSANGIMGGAEKFRHILGGCNGCTVNFEGEPIRRQRLVHSPKHKNIMTYAVLNFNPNLCFIDI